MRWSRELSTASVHFGASCSTVDVSAASPIPDATFADIEAEANELIASNKPVTVSFENSASATGLRKPSDRTGTIRVITIADVDRSACGGTHVESLAEIGTLLLRRVERMKGQQRIEFLCGRRALGAARSDYLTLQQLSRSLSAAASELPALIDSHVVQIKELEREQRRLQEELAQYRAVELWTAHPHGEDGIRRIHVVVPSGQARDQQQVAAAIARLGKSIVVVTGPATNSVLIASSEDSTVDAGATMKQLMGQFGGRGGGSPRLAQGSVPERESLDAIAAAVGCTNVK